METMQGISLKSQQAPDYAVLDFLCNGTGRADGGSIAINSISK